MKTMRALLKPVLLTLMALGLSGQSVQAETSRIKDLASVEGVRQNQLVGYAQQRTVHQAEPNRHVGAVGC